MMRKALSLVPLLLVAAAQLAPAQVSKMYDDWRNGPAGFLFTKQERKQWKKIHTDAAARRFMALFWARRDPDLKTLENEALLRFKARVAYADEHFATEDKRGALTDRGHLLILLGPPYRVEARGPTRAVETMDLNTSGTDQVWASALLWEYIPQSLPVKTKGAEVVFILYEAKANTNDFVIDRSHRSAPLGMRVLGKAPAALVVHPDLKEPPQPESWQAPEDGTKA